MPAEQDGNSTGVEIRQIEPQPILSIRGTIRTEQLGQAMGDRIEALTGYLERIGVQPAGPPFVRYHTFSETETDFELGVPVAEPVEGEGQVAAGELEGGPALSTWHFGPHDKLGDAYARIEAALDEHHREPAGPPREVYHWIDLSNGARTDDMMDPATWRTELILPVK
jgi:effector-binding domain-containing protein